VLIADKVSNCEFFLVKPVDLRC